MTSIENIRTDYKKKSLSEHDASSPFELFNDWWEEATGSNIEEVNAMTLATASADGVPSARIVLLRGFSEKGFVFYTNYNSFKGQQLNENPRACLVLFWKELERQVRVTGLVEKLSPAESDDYFMKRPESSRIGAWASPQSEVIVNRDWLETRENAIKQEFAGKNVTRPDFWGGFRVRPVTIEFWQGRASRLHDRLQFSLKDNNTWTLERLAP